jgi:hypothetical protein
LIEMADGTTVIQHGDGESLTVRPDGTMVHRLANGEVTTSRPGALSR